MINPRALPLFQQPARRRVCVLQVRGGVSLGDEAPLPLLARHEGAVSPAPPFRLAHNFLIVLVEVEWITVRLRNVERRFIINFDTIPFWVIDVHGERCSMVQAQQVARSQHQSLVPAFPERADGRGQEGQLHDRAERRIIWAA